MKTIKFRNISGTQTSIALKLLMAAVLAVFVSGSGYGIAPAFGSENSDLSNEKEIPVEFVTEPGCPVTTTNNKTILDLDPLGAPKNSRVYISFKNMGEKPVAAVKFRLRYVSQQGADLGTFHAAQAVILGPGKEAKGRWKGTRINPGTAALKLRVLQVRYSDGTIWDSKKVEEIEKASSTE